MLIIPVSAARALIQTLHLFVRVGRCLERACCAAAAAWLMLYTPTTAFAAPEALPYQEADQTPETQRAKTAPLSQDKQSAATDSSSQLPPLPTGFPLLPDIVVQAPQEVSCVLDCLPQVNHQELQGKVTPLALPGCQAFAIQFATSAPYLLACRQGLSLMTCKAHGCYTQLSLAHGFLSEHQVIFIRALTCI